MGVNEESLALNASKSPRHLHIKAKLESDLGLASACQSAHFDDLTQTEHHVQKLLRWVLLDISDIGEFSHQTDILSFSSCVTPDSCSTLAQSCERSR